MPIVFMIKNSQTNCNVIKEYSQALKESATPLVIDNGSYHCRVGWSSSVQPELDFKNVIAKNRGNRKEREWDVQIADEITDLEAVRWLLRTPHDFNIVVNYSIQETLFDYAFKCMGISTEDNVSHPLVITEPIANPLHCRKHMSELMFEAYSIPKLAYGIDCLFGYYFNNLDKIPKTALIISAGFQSTHILPYINGLPEIKMCKRINLGGYNCSAYLQRLLQFRHPHYAAELQLSVMDQIVQNVCHLPVYYTNELKKWKDITYKTENMTTLQFPSSKSVASANSKGVPILDQLLQLEKKLKQTEYKLYEMESITELEHENPELAAKVAKDAGFDNLEQLKENAENVRLEIKSLRLELDEQYHSDKNMVKSNLTCGVEKIQAPEILFQPSLVGYNQCGIAECIELILHQYPVNVRADLISNVFLTGGCASVQGFKERIFSELMCICPYQSEIKVNQASDASLDAWRGAAKWAQSDHEHWMSKDDFFELGWDYLNEHRFSNCWSHQRKHQN